MNGHEPEENQPMKEQDAVAEKSRALFDQASEHLDVGTANRLRLMRRDALTGSHRRRTIRWLPLGAAAATLLGVGVTWWLPHHGATTTVPTATAISAVDTDLSSDDDTEIYDWLGEAPVAVNDRQAGAQ